MRKILFVLFLVVFFSGCASGSAILIGNTRPVTDPKTVKLYLQEPKRFEVVGIVEASSEMGWTAQGSQDYAVAELKKQAAKIGANGVLLMNTGEKTSGAVGGYGTGVGWWSSTTAKTISGKAIYVYEE